MNSTDLGTAFGTVSTSVQSDVSAVLPYGLAVAAVIIGISVGYKLFRKFTGR